MEKNMSLGLKEALSLTLEHIEPLPAINVSLVDSVDRIAASDLYALVDSPTTDVSRKDGYAVLSHEAARATSENPVRLFLSGAMAAGGEKDTPVNPGTAVRILTGARIPPGADAVVAEEHTKREGNDVLIEAPAEPKNILPRGSDVVFRTCILKAGRKIVPNMTGLLAVAGHSVVPVYRKPIVGIIGTGDELVEPGNPLAEGKLYASNVVTLAAWCARYGMKTRTAIVHDNDDAIRNSIETMSDTTNAVVTSGGAWTGDYDLVAKILEGLGWRKVFHCIRIGPGKAVGFGMLNNKPVFILPGGPPSNLMGFLQIALPGLLALSGHANPVLPTMAARLAAEIRGGNLEWTDFFFGNLTLDGEVPTFYPMKKRSRLGSIAEAAAIASIPEDQDHILAGSIVPVQLLR